jgi:hypothetical protein
MESSLEDWVKGTHIPFLLVLNSCDRSRYCKRPDPIEGTSYVASPRGRSGVPYNCGGSTNQLSLCLRPQAYSLTFCGRRCRIPQSNTDIRTLYTYMLKAITSSSYRMYYHRILVSVLPPHTTSSPQHRTRSMLVIFARSDVPS